MENNVCKFCDQVLMPGEKCNCSESQQQEQKEIAFSNAVDEIKECAAGWGGQRVDTLIEGASMIIFDDDIKSFQIEDNFGVKIKLSSCAKGFIKIDKTTTSKSSISL